jgi:hypothetical protein
MLRSSMAEHLPDHDPERHQPHPEHGQGKTFPALGAPFGALVPPLNFLVRLLDALPFVRLR